MKRKYKLLFWVCAVIFSLLVVSICYGAEGNIPRITNQDLKKMMDEGKEIFIIDVQPKVIYDKGHIEGAVSIPWKTQLKTEDVFSIPAGIPIVIYCACGPGEADSSNFAGQLEQMGYMDVKVLKHPAIQGWIEAGYPIEKK